MSEIRLNSEARQLLRDIKYDQIVSQAFDNMDLDQVYGYVNFIDPNHIGRAVTLTDIYKKLGVDPLRYVNKIHPYMYAYTDITNLSLPNSIKYIGYCAFIHCSGLKSIELNDGLMRIDHNAFMYCDHLKKIVIPDSVKAINAEAFKWCESLEDITLGSGLMRLGRDIFMHCKSLHRIHYNGTIAQFKMITHYGFYNAPTIHCLDEDIV